MKKLATPTVLGAVAVLALGVYFYNKKTGSLWSNASGGAFAGTAGKQRCAVWRYPSGEYGSAGNGQTMSPGSTCMSKYA